VRRAAEMMNDPLNTDALVAFDFDGTLTVRDSFTAFLAWRAGSARWLLGLVKLTPAIIGYAFDRDRGRLKGQFVREFLGGQSVEAVENSAKQFAQLHAQSLFRPDAVATWRRWRKAGAKIVIVTASPEIIVAPFARGLGADMLIGSRLSVDANGKIRGPLEGANCRAAEKVTRLREIFGPDVHLKAAYGDTSGDHEMLKIADERGYRVFTAKPAGGIGARPMRGRPTRA
jgi:phosphatidylglycerophosphatase C